MGILSTWVSLNQSVPPGQHTQHIPEGLSRAGDAPSETGAKRRDNGVRRYRKGRVYNLHMGVPRTNC